MHRIYVHTDCALRPDSLEALVTATLTKDFLDEYGRYRTLGERAIAQAPDDALNYVPVGEGNSIGMIVRHVSGNLRSRFVDFLTSDGEKPTRDRDGEFAEQRYTRAEVERAWRAGFEAVEQALAGLPDEALTRTVTIRGVPLTVHEALCRSIAHTAQHTGQIVLLAKIAAGAQWKSLSIPRGQSAEYAQNPQFEKAAGYANATRSSDATGRTGS